MKSVQPLTLEQAVIVSAYTGCLCCSEAALEDAMLERLGWLPTKGDDFQRAKSQLRDAFRDDFLAICHSE